MSTGILIAYVVKLTFVLVVARVCAAVMRRASAAARHQVWASAVLAVLVLPVFVWAVPVWRVVVATTTEMVDAPRAIEQAEVARPGPVVVAEAPQSVTRGVAIGPMDVVIALWATGALLLLARLGWGLMQLRRLRVAVRLVERRPDGVCLLESASASSTPMAWGWRKPCVLLPAGFREWDDERLRVVLAHEFAHVARRDWVMQLAAQVAKCMYWFHPLAWLAAARVREESERAADDAVLRAGVDGPAYAQHLLEVARAHQDGLEPALGITGRSPIERRLGALLDRRVRRGAVSRRMVGMSFAASLAALVPFAAFAPGQEIRRVLTAPLKFDVASVKVSADGPFSTRPTRSPGRIQWTTQGIYLLAYAYGMEWWRISGSGEFGSKIYTIEAAADPSTTDAQLRLMMQSLLIDRFGLNGYRVTRDGIQGYALVVGKGGPKMEQAKDVGDPNQDGWVAAHSADGNVVELNGDHGTMRQLCDFLERLLSTSVLDQTGLNSKYNFKFQFLKDKDPQDYTAVVEAITQIGLKLERNKGPVEFLVVDKISKVPTEN